MKVVTAAALALAVGRGTFAPARHTVANAQM